MNDDAKQLVYDLKHNLNVRSRFDMSFFITQSLWCGTVGCIAGTLLIRKGLLEACDDNAFKCDNIIYTPDNSSFNNSVIMNKAAEILEIPEEIAIHLFLPNLWIDATVHGDFSNHYRNLWRNHPNWRCDLDTIEKMREWAKKYLYHGNIFHDIFADEAAIALEHCIDVHPGYVNWQEAIEA